MSALIPFFLSEPFLEMLAYRDVKLPLIEVQACIVEKRVTPEIAECIKALQRGDDPRSLNRTVESTAYFHGLECSKCFGNLRYAVTKKCVSCTLTNVKNSRARKAALAKGLELYVATPCNQCDGTERSTSDNSCLKCSILFVPPQARPLNLGSAAA